MKRFDVRFKTKEINNLNPQRVIRKDCSLEDVKEIFIQTFELYEKLFQILKNDSTFYLKPEPLRHPLIFYFAHTATFYVNKFILKGLLSDPINRKFEEIFAVGVDEMDWDDLDQTHYEWPSVQEVREYRAQIKRMVIETIQKINFDLRQQSDLWVVLMGIEHERIHFETSAVIIRRLPDSEIRQSEAFIDCPFMQFDKDKIPKSEMKNIPSFSFRWDRQIETTETYGWDSQFGHRNIELLPFSISNMLVSNGQYLQFVEDGGYEKEKYWDKEGLAWLSAQKMTFPLFWSMKAGQWKLKTMNKEIPLPLNWPAEVNNLEASAFCKWKGEKIGKKLRLPTEDEYYALRSRLKGDYVEWERGAMGNINLEYWFSPSPVDLFQFDGFYDLLGNVWQHCSTPLYPLHNFRIHDMYEDFTTPQLDSRHFMIKGGSFSSTGNYSFQFSRHAYRRHFYQFAGFRYVESLNQLITAEMMDENDEKVQQFLHIQYLDSNSYVTKIKQIVQSIKGEQFQNKRCLTLGCSVGAIPLFLSKIFRESYGTDYSARFFQMASRIMEKSELKYKDIRINLKPSQISSQNVRLYQMNPHNLNVRKIGYFDFVIIDGLSLKDKTICSCLQNVKKVMKNECFVVLVQEIKRNKISQEEIQTILGESTHFLIQIEAVSSEKYAIPLCLNLLKLVVA